MPFPAVTPKSRNHGFQLINPKRRRQQQPARHPHLCSPLPADAAQPRGSSHLTGGAAAPTDAVEITSSISPAACSRALPAKPALTVAASNQVSLKILIT